jgi:hypothetical protein
VAREWLTERFVPIQQSPTLPAQLEPTIAPAKRAAALSVDEARWALDRERRICSRTARQDRC